VPQKMGKEHNNKGRQEIKRLQGQSKNKDAKNEKEKRKRKKKVDMRNKRGI
jgi:hypothetical protein